MSLFNDISLAMQLPRQAAKCLAMRFSSAVILLLLFLSSADPVAGTCIESDPKLEAEFESKYSGEKLPREGSCCMKDICGLECPLETPTPDFGYGLAVIISIIIFFLIGVSTIVFVKGRSVNFFVAGRSLPMWLVAVTLSAQAVDSSVVLGNVNLAYRYSFFDGAAIPIGLGLSLILNGIFLAHHINTDNVLTLPDVLGKRYGRVVELLASLASVTSFIMLLASNLKGFSLVASYLWGISQSQASWTAACIILAYTTCGGLFSVAYTNIIQAIVGWTGCIVTAFWFIAHKEPHNPSIGYPRYTYPDTFGEGGACDLYNGTKCEYADGCCYNTKLWCPEFESGGVCDRYDRAQFPTGDVSSYSSEMIRADALDPDPNAIFWNWTVIFILGFGNLAALDFQARCMAAKDPQAARNGCFIAGLFCIFIGVPFSLLGHALRPYYGPDSIYSSFKVDSCSAYLGRPTCASWVPDNLSFLRMLTNKTPPFLGGWCLIGIISSSMSTANGAVLAMGTVTSHNVIRQLDKFFPDIVTPNNLLFMARLAMIPFTFASTIIAAYYDPRRPGTGAGYLLIVAFDIVLATVVVPLLGCFYAKSPSPRAALLAMLSGAVCRITLEFTIPKDGYLILPFDFPSFYLPGPAASANSPTFLDSPDDEKWNTELELCVQKQYNDFTGADSLASFFLSALVFVFIQFLEFHLNRPIFEFGQPFCKETSSSHNYNFTETNIEKILGELMQAGREEPKDNEQITGNAEVDGSVQVDD